MPHERAAQRRLAQELTTLVHGEAQCAAVEHASQALFGRGELAQLDEPTLAAALREASNNHVAELKPGGPDGITDLLVASGLVGQQGRRAADCRRGRRLRQQRPGGERRLDTAAVGLPARPVVGAASRQAEYRRRRTRWMICRSRRTTEVRATGGRAETHRPSAHLTPTFPSRNLLKSSRRGPPQSATASQREAPLRWVPDRPHY